MLGLVRQQPFGEEAEYEPIMLFINHSCEPNVGLSGNTALVAMRDIGPGEELTTDFALLDDHDVRGGSAADPAHDGGSARQIFTPLPRHPGP
jgi:hypothetical protein